MKDMLNYAEGKGIGSQQSDDTLMRAYRTGDFLAFEILFRRYKNGLFDYLSKNTGDSARARELFQDIWMSIVQRREAYNDSASFSLWLFTLAHKRLTDHERYLASINALRASNSVPRLSRIAWPLQSQEIKALSEDSENLEKAIQNLPAIHRKIFLMRQIWRLKVEEMAAIMEQPADLLVKRLRYANNKFRLLLRGTE